MTNETQSTPNQSEPKPSAFGDRLKSARESLGLEPKDAAAQLRLNERIIIMMEKDRYPADLPATFIRGYIRSYGKLLQIPENEIKKAIEPIKPKPSTYTPVMANVNSQSITSGNYFMQILTFAIILTLLGLVGMWWYTHSASPASATENQLAIPLAPPQAANAEVVHPPLLPNANISNNKPAASEAAKNTTTHTDTVKQADKRAQAAKDEDDDDDDQASETDSDDNETNSNHAD